MGACGVRKPVAGIANEFRRLAEYRTSRPLAGFYGLCKINHMQVAVRKFFAFMPLFFGIGFIAPLIAQSLTALHIAAPFGMEPVGFGLVVGGPWGLYATLRGSWL
jgi:hypothetical protein